MERIFGYGEDSLTYWALSTQLTQILVNLHDDTPQEQCQVFYRPSFRRSGGPTSSQFGEFEAIIQSSRSTYLIESKWDHLNPAPNEVVLQPVQILRHSIFKWMHRKWAELQPTSWPDFLNRAGTEFKLEFNGRTLANSGRLIARNCTELLVLLARGPAAMSNVLLYFASRGDAIPSSVVDSELQPLTDPFQLCILQFAALNDSGYFIMANS